MRWSGLAAMLGGICMILFVLVHPFGELDPPKVLNGLWVLTNSLRVVGAILVLFGLMGLYVLQAEKAGRLGLVSFVLAFSGTALFVGNGMIIAYVLPPLAVHTPDLASFNGPLSKEPVFALSYVFMILLLLVSYLLFGVSIMRAQVLPPWAAVLLILGALLFFEPPVLVPYVIPFVGALIFGMALAWLGSVLWFQKAKMARQPQVTVEGTAIS
jgi:hypothetical protein